ncbi:MAG: hypothetical protein V9G16_11635 [Nitrosomonas sp.]
MIKRLPELLFRYRARNWPETLTFNEAEYWKAMCLKRITQSDGGGNITLTEFTAQIALLRETYKTDECAKRIMDDLEHWCNNLLKF